MRKVLFAFPLVAALGVATAVPAFADEATFTRTVRGTTVTCTVTYTDNGDGHLGPRDIVTNVVCTVS
jgi:hypothetical protein